jgi:hypothetical protein
MQACLNRQIPAPKLSSRSGRHLVWLISVLVLVSFVLTDAAVVAWCAKVITTGEILACVLSFGLISFGLIVTVWKID